MVTRGTVTLVELDPEEAVTNAAWAVVKAPAVTVNVVEVAFAGTLAEAGVVRADELSAKVMTAPPAGAAGFTLTVQVALAPAVRLEGAH